jgi:hypothetical protein
MTKGEYRVGINFNPSSDVMVTKIKRAAADLIDLIDSIPLPKADGVGGLGRATAVDRQAAEVSRLQALAMTHVEDAAMWAVKAATKQPMEN